MLLRILPFLVTSSAYFLLLLPEPSLSSAIMKCLPTFCLALFVASQPQSGVVLKHYSRWIFRGLMFACVGDVCLVWPKLFLAGMGAFAICHICYIKAFGLAPFRPLTFLVIQGLMAVTYAVLLLPCLSGVYVWAVLLYSILLGVMAWRALSSPRRLSSLGSLIFLLSDLVVAQDKFCSPFHLARILYMATYYFAQCLIAFSVTSWKLSPRPAES